MTECVECGEKATHNTDPFSEYGVDVCRECWKARCNPRKGLKPRGPDWAEQNPEAADFEAARRRSNRLQGKTSGGRRL